MFAICPKCHKKKSIVCDNCGSSLIARGKDRRFLSPPNKYIVCNDCKYRLDRFICDCGCHIRASLFEDDPGFKDIALAILILFILFKIVFFLTQKVMG